MIKYYKYQIGDKLLCKRSLNINHTFIFRKGKFYKVLSQTNDLLWLCIEESAINKNKKSGYCFGIDENSIHVSEYSNFYCHFYSNKEMRKLKLEKIILYQE